AHSLRTMGNCSSQHLEVGLFGALHAALPVEPGDRVRVCGLAIAVHLPAGAQHETIWFVVIKPLGTGRSVRLRVAWPVLKFLYPRVCHDLGLWPEPAH